MNVIELNPDKRKHTLERKRPDYGVRVSPNGKVNCDHRRLLISERRSKVDCKDCDAELDPLEALFIVADQMWWNDNGRERQLEYDQKRVSKVQAAAMTCLFEAGITPEKYAARWAKLKEAEEQKSAPIAPEQKPLENMATPGGAA